MEADGLLDIGCCCCGVLMETFIHKLSTRNGRIVLFIGKSVGIILDLIAIFGFVTGTYNDVALGLFFTLIGIDRGFILLCICIFGYRPSSRYKQYAYYMENRFRGVPEKDQIKDDYTSAGLETIFYGSMFSTLDIIGRIWVSYSFIIKVPLNVPEYNENNEDNENKKKKNMQKQIEMAEITVVGETKTTKSNDKKKNNNWIKKTTDKSARSLMIFGLVYYLLIAGYASFITTIPLVAQDPMDAIIILSIFCNQAGVTQHLITINLSIFKLMHTRNSCGCCCTQIFIFLLAFMCVFFTIFLWWVMIWWYLVL